MIFKITIDETDVELNRLLGPNANEGEYYFSVTGVKNGVYYLDASWVRDDLILKVFEGDYCYWVVVDHQGIFEPAYNACVEILDSFPSPF